jgi:hypothetical protein
MPVPAIDRSDVPADLDRLLRAAMTKDPQARQRLVASAGEFALRLRDIQQSLGYPVTDLVVYDPVDAEAPSSEPGAEAGSRTTRAGVVVEPEVGSATTNAWADPADVVPAAGRAQIPRRDVFVQNWERAPFDDPAARPTRERPTPPPGPGLPPLPAFPDPPARRGMPRTAILVAVLLAVVVVGAGALLLRGGGDIEGTGGTGTPTPAVPGYDAVPGAGKPVPKPTVTAARQPDGSVRFAWTYDDTAGGDYFKVKRTDIAGKVQTLTKPELVVRAKAGEKPCLDVYVYRSDGRGSQEPGRVCVT